MNAAAYDRVIRGSLVTPEGIVPDGWIAVADGRIAAMGSGAAPSASDIFEAGDRWVAPGAIDGQTHAGSYQGLKGIEPTTRSAAAGGVTTLVDMPYDNPDRSTPLSGLKPRWPP